MLDKVIAKKDIDSRLNITKGEIYDCIYYANNFRVTLCTNKSRYDIEYQTKELFRLDFYSPEETTIILRKRKLNKILKNID